VDFFLSRANEQVEEGRPSRFKSKSKSSKSSKKSSQVIEEIQMVGLSSDSSPGSGVQVKLRSRFEGRVEQVEIRQSQKSAPSLSR
jgi:hypothetical protein